MGDQLIFFYGFPTRNRGNQKTSPIKQNRRGTRKFEISELARDTRDTKFILAKSNKTGKGKREKEKERKQNTTNQKQGARNAKKRHETIIQNKKYETLQNKKMERKIPTRKFRNIIQT